MRARPPRGFAGALFEQPGLAMVVVDPAGCIARANSALRALAGADAELCAGAPAGLLFVEADREMASAEVADCLRGLPRRPSFRAVLRCGAPVDVSATVVREPGGRVRGAVLRLTDVSAHRALEAQLAQAQKLSAMGQMAAGIAHDFNNLLTAILGAADSLAGQPALPPEAAEDIGEIRASAGRGAALVRQLLALGRPPSPPLALALNDVVADIAGMLRRMLGGQIRLDVELEQPGGLVRADPGQLDQILVNLAVNARDAMPTGGVLTLRTGQLTLPDARAHGAEAVPPGRYIVMEVVDTGVGIPRDILPRIFDPFFTTRGERGGSGLGLATVGGIVRQANGFIEVESAAEAGTTIRVLLPREGDGPASIPKPPERHGPGALPSPRVERGVVLVVDDDAAVRRLAERALARAGWDVLSSESGEQALALLAERGVMRLRGLVTDLAMHGMDGVRLLRAVRSHLSQADLPALLVSGYAPAALRDALAGEQRVAFLAKPYALAELAAAFEAVAASPLPDPTMLADLTMLILREPADLSIATRQVSNI